MINGDNNADSLIMNNLSRLFTEQSVLEERRICEIKELIDALINGVRFEFGLDLSAYEFLSVLSERINLTTHEIHRDALKIDLDRLSSFARLLCSADKLIFCDLIVEQARREFTTLKEEDFLLCEDQEETFIYVKNAFADEAYDVFSQDFTDPRVKYAIDFKSALKSLENENIGYFIIPFEERGGRRLQTVDELIFRNDLKVNAVTPVFGFDGLADMKYALVSKRFSKLSREIDDDCYLEIRIPADSDVSLSELLVVSEGFGLSVYRTDTAYFENDQDIKRFYSIVFRSEKGNFTRLLVYLTLFTGNYSIVGLYKNLE